MEEFQTVYEMSFNLIVEWQAHSLSTIGSNGTNRVLPRRQLLSDGTEVDACSGNILKNRHASIVAPYFLANRCPLCPACRRLDSRRAAALLDHPDYQPMTLTRVLNTCALCDTHGFLVTAKNPEKPEKKTKTKRTRTPIKGEKKGSEEDGATEEEGEEEKAQEARPKMNKETLIDFSYGLALPDQQAVTSQIHTRSGQNREEGQMLIKVAVRSGAYALLVRYLCVGIGADTERWELHVPDPAQRRQRHKAILLALRDQLVSPSGAQVATFLPHLTGLRGAIVLSTGVGRAPCYSPLDPTFQTRLQNMTDPTCHIHSFDGVDTFYQLMRQLAETTVPALHPGWNTSASDGQGDTKARAVQ